MTNDALATSYLVKSQKRLKALEVLFAEESHSDVIREAQEIVELCLKAMLRFVGIDPPRWHDVSPLIPEHADRFPSNVQKDKTRIAEISKRLRKEREFAFYGHEDFIPTDEYTRDDALQALEEARWIVSLAQQVIQGGK